MDHNYSFSLLWSAKDECYIARCPEFPGLSAFGDTPQEAIEEGIVALELFLEEYQESGRQLPPSRELEGYSGQTRVRIPRWLHAGLAERAGVEAVSLNTLMVSFLASGLGKVEREDRIEEELLSIRRQVKRLDVHIQALSSSWHPGLSAVTALIESTESATQYQNSWLRRISITSSDVND